MTAGKIDWTVPPTTESKRDATHVALEPARARSELRPGCRVSICAITGWAYPDPHGIGAVSPFLESPVPPGGLFWMMIKPNTVTNLRHTFDCASIPPEGCDLGPSDWKMCVVKLMNFADILGVAGEKFLEAAMRAYKETHDKGPAVFASTLSSHLSLFLAGDPFGDLDAVSRSATDIIAWLEGLRDVHPEAAARLFVRPDVRLKKGVVDTRLTLDKFLEAVGIIPGSASPAPDSEMAADESKDDEGWSDEEEDCGC